MLVLKAIFFVICRSFLRHFYAFALTLAGVLGRVLGAKMAGGLSAAAF
jgi:hypothetical protein